jgi:hypothetical protein
MAEHFQSVGNLFKDFVINLFSGLAGGAIIGIWTRKFWLGLLIFGLLLVASLAYLLFNKYKRLFKLIRVGAAGYYYSFDLGENRKIFREVNTSFCYLGISANSIIELFRKWASENPPINHYSFLLMDPQSEELKRQIAFEKGVSLDTELSSLLSSNVQLSQTIDEALKTERNRIATALEVLKNLTLYKEGKLKVRLHSQFIPWWMYVIDDKMIYLGILERGKRGQECPVMTMSKVPDFPSPFEAFRNTWDRMWAEAKEA